MKWLLLLLFPFSCLADGFLSSSNGVTLIVATPGSGQYLAISNGTTVLSACGLSINYLTVTNGTTLTGLSAPCVIADLTGVLYRWVAIDAATNTGLTSWTDEISGVVWTNGNSSVRPTNNAASGVFFDVSHYFTNGGLTLDFTSNCAMGFIIKVIDNGKFPGTTHPGLLNNTAQLGSDTVHVLGLMFHANGYALSMEGAAAFSDLTEAPFQQTNVFIDIVFSQAISNGNSGGLVIYTNGISDKVINGSLAGAYWGESGGNPTPSYFNSLGYNQGRGTSAGFFLQELWTWTNAAPGAANGALISATSLANFHKYGTNKYSYSP